MASHWWVISYFTIGLIFWSIDVVLCLKNRNRPSMVWLFCVRLSNRSAMDIVEWFTLGCILSVGFWLVIVCIDLGLITLGLMEWIASTYVVHPRRQK